ncbi:hypothetical protein MKZ38_008523 [Zalerion maritima]|uniref:Uncharacterized protein n=1 Tax=Zalerion maritima TaxID=339359 RepID=A0AAD5RHD5_9PEZI|nr:hypothetical protein MKZ38_008523 [Zalerion maritima]
MRAQYDLSTKLNSHSNMANKSYSPPPTIDAALGTHEMAHEQKSLLDLIDKLQFAQLDNVKLPQIVVVGDQSAGKSSVLEAITGTPFPRDSGACTRFATEIRLRRDKESSLTVSIIPDKNRSFQEQARLKDYGGLVDNNMPFDTLMMQAVDLIAPKNIPGRFAAKDILVVEKRGPDMPLLTLVDLPGLVRNANRDQSSEDIRTIEALSDRYMKSRRTIILAVVGGNSDYVQAPILTKARQFDPTGSRTIGVLTKPDLTESIGLEDKFIELVQNRDRQNHFKLGWYVLLNPGPREPGQDWPTAEERQEREITFFARGKWNVLPTDMCGAAALKRKLSVQLQHHIGRHVKVLRKQIQAALDKCERELKSMGEGKDTVGEMRIELVELFSSSKELVIPAVYGFYKNPPGKRFFSSAADPNGTPAQNLRARAVEENDYFSTRVRANGRKFQFASKADGHGDGGKGDFARREVDSLLRQVRGSEFPGDAKPRAVYMLFQSYSENWPVLAQEHKDNLGVVCNEFLSEVIDYVWPSRMREPLRAQFLDPQMKGLMEKARDELERLVGDMHLEVQPYDPEYEETLRNWRKERMKDGGTYTEAEEVLEKMLIYYELSAKSYIRNVITQVVERHLLQGLYGIFKSAAILNMSDATIEAIGSENKETRDRRIALKKQKKAIEEARDICASLAMRKDLRAYAEETDVEDTSDDEVTGAMKRKGVMNPTPAPTPAGKTPSGTPPTPKARDNRRSRRDDRPQPTTSTVDTSVTNTHASIDPRTQYPNQQHTGYMESPSTPSAWNPTPVEDYYQSSPTTPKAPSQAPPPVPPPRPTKVPQYEPQGDYHTPPTSSTGVRHSGSEGFYVGGDESYRDGRDRDSGSMGRTRLTPKFLRRS